MGDANSSDLLSPLTYRPAMIRLSEIVETYDHSFPGLIWIACFSDISEKIEKDRQIEKGQNCEK